MRLSVTCCVHKRAETPRAVCMPSASASAYSACGFCAQALSDRLTACSAGDLQSVCNGSKQSWQRRLPKLLALSDLRPPSIWAGERADKRMRQTC